MRIVEQLQSALLVLACRTGLSLRPEVSDLHGRYQLPPCFRKGITSEATAVFPQRDNVRSTVNTIEIRIIFFLLFQFAVDTTKPVVVVLDHLVLVQVLATDFTPMDVVCRHIITPTVADA